MTDYLYRTALVLLDDSPNLIGEINGGQRTRLQAGGLLAYAITEQTPDLDCWERAAPTWYDVEQREYKIMDASMRLQDIEQIPMFLGIVCQDGDPAQFSVQPLEGRAYDSNGILLGAYVVYDSPGISKFPDGEQALNSLGIARTIEELQND